MSVLASNHVCFHLVKVRDYIATQFHKSMEHTLDTERLSVLLVWRSNSAVQTYLLIMDRKGVMFFNSLLHKQN